MVPGRGGPLNLHFQPILMTEIVNFHISDLIHLGLGELVFYCTHAWSQYPEKGAVLFLHGLCRHDQMRVHIRGHVSNVRDKRTPFSFKTVTLTFNKSNNRPFSVCSAFSCVCACVLVCACEWRVLVRTRLARSFKLTGSLLIFHSVQLLLA